VELVEIFNLKQNIPIFVIALVANIISSLVIFLFGLLYLAKPRVKISPKMIKGINMSNNSPIIVYKFKIVNTSHVLKARDFKVVLYAIKRIRNQHEGKYTEHSKLISEISCDGLYELSTFVSDKKVCKLMNESIGNDDFSCWHRIIAPVDITTKYKDYDLFKLVIRYETVLNQVLYVRQYFKNSLSNIFVGHFSIDGNLKNTYPLSAEEDVHYRQIEKVP